MTHIQLNTKHFKHEATLDSGWFVFEHDNGDFVANFETDDNDNASEIVITESNDSYGNPLHFELTDSIKREIRSQIDLELDHLFDISGS